MRLNDSIRKKSVVICKGLGYEVNDKLPSIESVSSRSIDCIAARIGVLHCLIACAYGFPITRGREWLEENDLLDHLSPSERKTLFSKEEMEDFSYFKTKVECLWVLVWSVGLISKLDFSDYCGDELIELMPKFKEKDSIIKFKDGLIKIPDEEIIQNCDLAYCLHWSLVDSEVNGRDKVKEHLPSRVIIERRRALEWILSDDDWDEISLDT